ncbi:MAG: LTA synthase family protein [Verrucomicrobia bacterium]|nr:LTA synthase family protein [Verrucomicrobiota bacterium]
MNKENAESSPGASLPLPGPGCSCRRSRYGLAGFFLVSLLLVWLALRAVLFVQFGHDQPVAVRDILAVFAIGLYRDFCVGLLMCVPLLFWFAVASNRAFGKWWHRTFLQFGFFLFWLVQIFLLFTEYFFFEEFLSRFNTVAVDYLLYPHEVFINIWDSYPVGWVIAGCAAVSGGWVWLAGRWFRGMWECAYAARQRFALWLGLVVVGLILGQTISLNGPRFSRERVLNELANNGTLSFVAAFWTHHLDYAAFYRTMPPAEAYQRVRKLLKEPGTEFETEGQEIRRRVSGDPARPKLNVVILLEESLGSEFWGSLGRKEPTLTPEMDQLAKAEGLLFTNIYASGNRTVRGFEGVFSSFPPLPGDSIVKRVQSGNVETIARILKRDGYSTVFFYGGRGLFDGMRSYAVRNGYDRFIEQKHFSKPTFSTIWGVCDEDVMARAVEEFRELAKTGQPFLGTILSVSNHKPYTYPKGRIAENPDARLRENAVKYSDYALGQFFKAAKKEPFWTNTVFVVVADHGARVYGSQSIPIHSYEIPLLIAGPAVVRKPERLPHLGCSLDVSPVILGLICRPYETMFFGRDLLKSPAGPGRVFINHNRDIGLYERERLVVLGLRQTIEFYQGDPKVVDMKRVKQPDPAELDVEQDCIALYQVADDLYMHRRYRIDR